MAGMVQNVEQKSFLLYLDNGELFSLLSDRQAGTVIKAVFAYLTGAPLPSMTKEGEMLFTVLRRQLDNNRKQYQQVCKINQENGKKGGRPRKEQETPSAEPNMEKTEITEKTQRFSEKPLKDKDKDKENDKDKDKKREKKQEEKNISSPLSFSPSVQDDFLKFWKAYPRKAAMEKARAQWQQLSPTPKQTEAILTALQQAKASPQWSAEGGRYIPNGANWLRDKRWEEFTSASPCPDNPTKDRLETLAFDPPEEYF
jgi:hypothetical protein